MQAVTLAEKDDRCVGKYTCRTCNNETAERWSSAAVLIMSGCERDDCHGDLISDGAAPMSDEPVVIGARPRIQKGDEKPTPTPMDQWSQARRRAYDKRYFGSDE